MKWLWNALHLHIGTYLKSYLLINKILFLTATPTYFDWRVKAKKSFPPVHEFLAVKNLS